MRCLVRRPPLVNSEVLVIMSFNVISDLHLELGGDSTLIVTAPYLLVAGDISLLHHNGEQYCNFLEKVSALYKHVVWIAGNHCLYDGTVADGYTAAHRLCVHLPNVHFLQRETFDIPETNITVVGCTLFSNIPEWAAPAVCRSLLDFRRTREWTIKSYNRAHRADVGWIKQTVEQIPPDRRIVLLTHHAPLDKNMSSPQYDLPPPRALSCAFQTDIENLIPWHRLTAAVSGHTHYSVDFVHHGVKIWSNQKGYKGEDCGYRSGHQFKI